MGWGTVGALLWVAGALCALRAAQLELRADRLRSRWEREFAHRFGFGGREHLVLQRSFQRRAGSLQLWAMVWFAVGLACMIAGDM